MSGGGSHKDELGAAKKDAASSFSDDPMGRDAEPCPAPDRLVIEWPNALDEHLPASLRIRLVLGERTTDIPWSEGEVDGDERRFTFEDVRPGSLCTLFAVTSARTLRLWRNQRANDPDNPPTFERWLEELLPRPSPPGEIVDLGPMSDP